MTEEEFDAMMQHADYPECDAPDEATCSTCCACVLLTASDNVKRDFGYCLEHCEEIPPDEVYQPLNDDERGCWSS